MEIRARNTLIGAFTLAVILGIFGFVYWLHNAGGLGERQQLRVVFGNSVSGLLNGSPVYFNGIRVGEVTALRFNPEQPEVLEAHVSIDKRAPVRADTVVGLDFQGLTGVSVITLAGGSADGALLSSSGGQTPILRAPSNAGQSLTQAAQTALQRINTVLEDSATPLASTLDNIKTFSDALSRNSNRVDGIMAGLERMTGGASKGNKPVFDLIPPSAFPQTVKVPDKQIIIPEVSAAIMLDNEKIAMRRTATENGSIEGGQWSDSLPRLLQLRLTQSFENAGFAGSIAKVADGFNADYQLLIDVRAFQLATAQEPTAEIEFGAKLLSTEGKIVAGRLFQAKMPAKAADASSATTALNEAFADLARQLVVWVSETLANPS